MSSGDVTSTFEEADSDILLLLYDRCQAYQPASICGVGSRKNIIEVISAVGFDDIAAEPGEHFFTPHLVEILSLSSRRGPVKGVDLPTELIKRLQAWTPSRSRQTQQRGRHGGFERDDRGLPESAGLSLVTHGLQPETEGLSLASQGVIQTQWAHDPGVLIAIRLHRDGFDVQAQAKWILEAPPGAREFIKIEGCFGSFSTLLLVRLPMQVWSLLPESAAVSFVGFVTTDNSVPTVQKEVEHYLAAARDAPGRLAEAQACMKDDLMEADSDFVSAQSASAALIEGLTLNRRASFVPDDPSASRRTRVKS
ncbi:hypothetical protein B0H63DRAFT_565172 [Podospora didyma]|uniref:Uncharacterized protein n=1 Tax=Podospora didyma TaxID=330526 RepID=A0AAE0K2K8_9PEZI|nr:hypothetical protein B0H63DRAFT_565172 [Podospora didyma]